MKRSWWLPLIVLQLGCVLHQPPTLPSGMSVTREQLIIFSDFSLPKHHRLLEELTAQRSHLANLLDLPYSDEPIYVYLFDSAKPYERYVREHYPDCPHRRAFFVESDTRLTVYAHWGDRVAEDLRHEVAHGYLHSVVPNLPLWLDEGLAEYFEVPRGRQGINGPHLLLLAEARRKGQWNPDLERLEQLATASEMTQQDYAEAWAWVHWMLKSEDDHKPLLQNYLARLRVTGEAPPVSRLLQDQSAAPPEALLQHLESLTR